MVQYINTMLLPASSPPGHPKVIDDCLEDDMTTENFDVIDTIATFLYKSRRIGLFFDIDKYKFVDIRRENRATHNIDFYVERRFRCVSVCTYTRCLDYGHRLSQ